MSRMYKKFYNKDDIYPELTSTPKPKKTAYFFSKCKRFYRYIKNKILRKYDYEKI